MKKYFNIFKYVFLIFCFLFFVLVSKQSSKKTSQSVMGTTLQSEKKYHLACPFSKDVYEFQENNNQLVIKKTKAKAVIVSHHLLAKDLINEVFNQLISDYDTIILVGPNHFNFGPEPIQTTLLDWKTKFDWLKPDNTLITSLALNNLVEINEENFNTEHSICGLVSFLKIHFPESKVVPIILKTNASIEQVENLGQVLVKTCYNCLLVASIDFSHEVSQWQAEINDKKSVEILEKLDGENLDQVVSDSLPTLQLLFSYLKESGVNKGNLITNSNSFNISNYNPNSVTSYITFIY